MTSRETYLALLYNGPLYKADAVVVLCGEDAAPRFEAGAQLMRNGAALKLVLSGGKDEPPRCTSAQSLFGAAMGKGISHSNILLDNESQNTREQAVNAVALASEHGWRRILLVASSYHLPRAFLTFVKVLQEAGATEHLQVLPVSASQSSWGDSPEGVGVTRLDLLSVEAGKITAYTDHVATYEEGIDYLLYWEKHA